MRMDEFMNALQTQLANQQPHNESSGFDNAAIKADFEELYQLMNGKSLKEIDEIIYAVCTLCRDHEKMGFIEGIEIGMRLASELNIP